MQDDLNAEILRLQAENSRLKSALSKRIGNNSDLDSQVDLLGHNKERFFMIINSMSDALCVIDDYGHITYANPVAINLLKFDILVGENFLKLLHTEDKNNLKSFIDKPNSNSIVTKIKDSEGTQIPIRASWSSLIDENGKLLGKIVVFNDFSLDLEIQNKLEMARDRAVEMSKLKSEFLATMSHEIRTPLNGIVSLVTLLETSELNEEQREDIEDLKASSNQLQEIISNILDLSKIEAGKMCLDYQKFSLKHLLSDISKIFSSQFEHKEVLFISEIVGDLPLYLNGDYSRLKQILVNLIGNAIKFSFYKGSVLLLVKGKCIEGNLYNIEFSVIDTGIGISRKQIDSLFVPFVQADGSITRNFGGTGLGLSICKNLVDLMGGNISAKSKEGIGTVFSFDVNLKIPNFSEESLTRLKTIRRQTPIKSQNDSTILVVDDNRINLSTTTRFLKKYGHKALSATSGDEALAIIEKNQIDLILLDLHMPNMSGYEVTRCLRELDIPISKVPIIALTADALEGTEKACFDAGFNGYVSKPINHVALIKLIDNLTFHNKTE